MRKKQSGHKYFSDFGEGCEGILSVSERHGQLPADNGERKKALADYMADPNDKDNQRAVEYHVYRKYMNKKVDFQLEEKGFFIDGKGSRVLEFNIFISDHAMFRMDERCIDKRLLKSRISNALLQLRRKSMEINKALAEGKDLRPALREYKNILTIQGDQGARKRLVLKDKGFKLVFESSEVVNLDVGKVTIPFFAPKNGKVGLELVSLMYDVKKLSPISDAVTMKELADTTKIEDCTSELRRELVFLAPTWFRGEAPILNFEVQLPNLQTNVKVRLEDEGEEALAYFLMAHKSHIEEYLLKADKLVGSRVGANISIATEMLDEDEIVEAISPFVFLNVEDTDNVEGISVPTEIMVEIDPAEHETCINELFLAGYKVNSITPKKFASKLLPNNTKRASIERVASIFLNKGKQR